MLKRTDYITKRYDVPNGWTIDVYEKDGGYKQAKRALSMTREALADFHYSGLTLALDRSPSGDGSLLVGLKGNNPAVLDGHPFDINIRLDANFDRLATIFLSGYAAAEGLLRSAAGR